MATTKATGTSRLGRDSKSKRLGIKLFEGQRAAPGQVLIKQRGTKFLPGKNVKRGGDDTLYAVKAGVVYFTMKRKIGFNHRQRLVKIVNLK